MWAVTDARYRYTKKRMFSECGVLTNNRLQVFKLQDKSVSPPRLSFELPVLSSHTLVDPLLDLHRF